MGKAKGEVAEMPEVSQVDNIGRMIYTLRGLQVMLDYDLASWL